MHGLVYLSICGYLSFDRLTYRFHSFFISNMQTMTGHHVTSVSQHLNFVLKFSFHFVSSTCILPPLCALEQHPHNLLFNSLDKIFNKEEYLDFKKKEFRFSFSMKDPVFCITYFPPNRVPQEISKNCTFYCRGVDFKYFFCRSH